MESDILIYLVWGILWVSSAGILLFASEKAVKVFKAFLYEALPILRRLFDPNSLLLAFLKARGIEIDQAKADSAAEVVADAIQKWLEAQTPAKPEEAMPRGG